MVKLDGRIAVVTGGARGMGASHARKFVHEGAHVLITDLLEDQGHVLAEELGPRARFAVHDVRSSADWDRVIATAEREFGNVDVLVNNAGIGSGAPIEETSETDYRRVIDVNQVGVFLGMKAVLGSMRRVGKGSIVNISSIAAFVGEAGAISYTASKYAVLGMSKVAAKEFAPFGIRVNSVHPGVIATPILSDAQVPDDVVQALVSATPIGRIGQPEEVSAIVAFLASDDASFVTGSAYVVDGGFLR
jgi:3alpha(or 20beta)-hydroxysteroid dehydrogenase